MQGCLKRADVLHNTFAEPIACSILPPLLPQVPEETPLSDGDYVVLARDRVRI